MSRTIRLWLLPLLFLLSAAFLFSLLREDTASLEVPERSAPSAPAAVGLGETQLEDRAAIPVAAPSPETVPEVPDAPETVEAPIERPPSGTLEVHVLFEDAEGQTGPLSGSSVRVAPASEVYRTGAPPLLRPESVVAEQAAGASGVALFEGLESGDWYVEARTPRGRTRYLSVTLRKEEGRRVLLRFGSGRVFGLVSDPATGEPIEFAALRLSLQRTRMGNYTYEAQRGLAEQGRAASSLSVTTGSDGRFEFNELSAGEASLWLEPAAYDPENKKYTFLPRRFVDFELAPGEERQIDFPQLDGAIWTGRILSRTGEPVIEVAGGTSRLDVRRRGDFGYRQVQDSFADGAFRLHLPAGSYEVFFKSPFNTELVQPPGEELLELEAGRETNRDLVLPGTRVRATVVDAGGAPLQGLHGYPVGAHLEGQTHSAAWYSTTLGEDGTFVLDGLGPGEWVVGAGYSGDSVNLTVGESDLELAVTITIP